MLKNVPSIISAHLISVLMDMGHGDEIVIGDGNFPGVDIAKRVIYANGHGAKEMLEAILKLISLDEYVEKPVALMETTEYFEGVPEIWEEYRAIINNSEEKDKFTEFEFIERYEYYERAKKAFAIIITSEPAFFGNIIIKKGVL